MSCAIPQPNDVIPPSEERRMNQSPLRYTAISLLPSPSKSTATKGGASTCARQLATVNAVRFNEAAASADWGDPCGTPVGKPLNVTLGFEKFWIRTQITHDV